MVWVFHEGATMRVILAAMLPESAAPFKRKVARARTGLEGESLCAIMRGGRGRTCGKATRRARTFPPGCPFTKELHMLARHRAVLTCLLLAVLVLIPSLAAQDKKDPPKKEEPPKKVETPKKEEAPKKEAPKKGRVRRGWRLGIGLGATLPGHHQIMEVREGSPAAALGLKPGMVIVAVDGKVVPRNPGAVAAQIADATSINIVYHDGKTLYSVDADLEDDSSGFGKKVKGTPTRTELVPKKKGAGE
jgi:hypothetical protein